MALARRSRGDTGMNYWPGFVDALSTLILSVIFLLSVFVVVQFFMAQEVSGKDTALQRLNAQIAQLTNLLSLEKTGAVDLEQQIAQLRAGLATAESERDRLKGAAEAASGAAEAQRPGQPADQRARYRRRRCPRARWRRSRRSISRSPRCAASSARWNPRSMFPTSARRNRRPGSRNSASG